MRPSPWNPPIALSRRELFLTSLVAASSASRFAVASPSLEVASAPVEVDCNGIERLKFQRRGWNSWQWRSHKINWLSAGNESGTGPIILLVHGFGASVYHWRFLVPALAKAGCRVYALDCLGFGWSDKALVDYSDYSIWTDQIADFTAEVILKNSNGGHAQEKIVLVGNSLGGYNSLAAAATHPNLVKGVVLLNAAGRFESALENGDEPAAPAADAAAAAANESLLKKLMVDAGAALKRFVIGASFVVAKQPARVRQVLRQVYVSDRNLDADLVDSILIPAGDPNAAEVFYRVITARGTPVNRLLDRIRQNNENGSMTRLFLLWGSRDPWCVPARATQIQEYYPDTDRVDIESGHCPHDDTPELVAPELLQWVKGLDA